MKRSLIALLLSLTVLSGCIKEEAANAECDIIGVDSLWLKANKAFIMGEPIVTNNHVSFNIKKGTDRTCLAPVFYLTPGARIMARMESGELPAEGLQRDFSSPQTYVVYSEDGHWSKEYSVSFNYPTPLTHLAFEYFDLDKTGRYYQWYEVDTLDKDNPRRDYWASGNSGFALTGKGKKPENYPTTVAPLGVLGNCVKLETCHTGSFGAMANMPIAAGNLFIGEFRTEQAMKKPLEATRMGLQLVGGKPLYLTGYYKYTAADVFTDKKGKVDASRADTCDIYSVLFEVDPEKFDPLDGSNVLSSDRIVMVARIDNPGEPQEWTFFQEPYQLMPGKEFSEDRLRGNGYAITVVATSSRQGAFFEGAVGSVLYVDELRIIWEGTEQNSRKP